LISHTLVEIGADYTDKYTCKTIIDTARDPIDINSKKNIQIK